MKNVEAGNRKAKAAETKKKIIECAYRLFTTYGFEQVSVDSIVEAAGVSKGTFYVHFDSKDSLIALLTADYVRNLDMDYKAYLDSLPKDKKVTDIILSITEKIFDTIVNVVGHDIMRIIYGVQLTKTVNMDPVMGYNRNLYNIFAQIINQGIEQGEFRTDISPETVVRHLILAMRGLTYEWLIRYPDFNLKEQALIHIDMLLSGIRKHK